MGYVKHKGYTFGPVPSRRLGRSLGIDLVPFKTCTFDCIYCQIGRTTNKTTERREWVPLQGVLEELYSKLAFEPDYITLGGSGEPTLYSRLGDLVDGIRSLTDIPIALLTNGSLLWKKEIRDQLRNVDLVLPSLDAGDRILYAAINRPHPVITYERLVEGLGSFRQEFKGRLWLEVFLLAGFNATDDEVRKIAKTAKEIGPDLVQLNTCVRPPAEKFAYPVPWRNLVELADLFTPAAEVIVDSEAGLPPEVSDSDSSGILDMLQRRPCTAADVATGLRIHPAEVRKELETLMREGVIEARKAHFNQTYYVAKGEPSTRPASDGKKR